MFLSKIFKYLQGRTTSYILGFFFVGNVMQWFHKLDGNYTAFMSALLAAALGHSWKEDKHEQSMAQITQGSANQGLGVDNPDAGANNASKS